MIIMMASATNRKLLQFNWFFYSFSLLFRFSFPFFLCIRLRSSFLILFFKNNNNNKIDSNLIYEYIHESRIVFVCCFVFFPHHPIHLPFRNILFRLIFRGIQKNIKLDAELMLVVFVFFEFKVSVCLFFFCFFCFFDRFRKEKSFFPWNK